MIRFPPRHPDSVKPPHESSRQRSCSAPNLRRSPRHSPAVPGVPSLVEMGKRGQLPPADSRFAPSARRRSRRLEVARVADCPGRRGRRKTLSVTVTKLIRKKHRAHSAKQTCIRNSSDNVEVFGACPLCNMNDSLSL